LDQTYKDRVIEDLASVVRYAVWEYRNLGRSTLTLFDRAKAVLVKHDLELSSEMQVTGEPKQFDAGGEQVWASQSQDQSVQQVGMPITGEIIIDGGMIEDRVLRSTHVSETGIPMTSDPTPEWRFNQLPENIDVQGLWNEIRAIPTPFAAMTYMTDLYRNAPKTYARLRDWRMSQGCRLFNWEGYDPEGRYYAEKPIGNKFPKPSENNGGPG